MRRSTTNRMIGAAVCAAGAATIAMLLSSDEGQTGAPLWWAGLMVCAIAVTAVLICKAIRRDREDAAYRARMEAQARRDREEAAA